MDNETCTRQIRLYKSQFQPTVAILPDIIVLISGIPLPAAYVKTTKEWEISRERVTHIIHDLALRLWAWILVLAKVYWGTCG